MTTPDASGAGDDVATLSTLLDQLTGAAPADSAESPSDPDADEPTTLYETVAAWVDDYLLHVIERRIAAGAAAGVHWCQRWWAHPEALSRIYALWRAWEHLRIADPATGMSAWWRDHLDPHLSQLINEYGPFDRCAPAVGGEPAKHVDPAPLPAEPMPADVLAQLPDGQ